MKVLFVCFNIGSTVGINNGLAILSAVLKARNHQVDLLFLSEDIGYGFDLERMRRDIARIKPDVIGISIMEPQFKYAEEFCNDLKNYYKGFVVCGGPYPTMDPETVISVDAVDAVCIGEGEDTIYELVESLKFGRDCTQIKNLWVKNSDRKIIKNRLRPFTDLSKLPPEDKELFDLKKILPLKNYQLETMLSRGCIYKCTYCINDSYVNQYKKMSDSAVSLKSYTRIKNIDTAITEIKNVILKFPEIKKIAFIDDNFMVYNDFIEEFCKKYKKDIRLPFLCNVNPMSFDLTKVKLLKEAGCDDIRFGIESGSERVKKEIMKRPITNKSVVNAFKQTNELGMMSSSFNMIGLPTETKEEVFDTLKLNAVVQPDSIKLMTFYPFKNTPIYDMCEKLDLIDYEKKKELDDYDSFSCLKFPEEHQLFLKKMQTAFNWYVNVFLDNEASLRYKKLIETIEPMNEDEWDDFEFSSVDKEISYEMRDKGVPHYSKFVNRSLAVRFPSKHLQNEI